MKRLTTIICCVAMMFVAVSAAFMDFEFPSNKTMMAATMPEPLQWNQAYNNQLPLDIQLNLDERLSHAAPTATPERITDTVYVDRIKWKTRYKTIPARTEARNMGKSLTPVTPDSLPRAPMIVSTPNREEEIGDFVGDPKSPSIQLTVDGVIVYQSEDVIHSTEESQ